MFAKVISPYIRRSMVASATIAMLVLMFAACGRFDSAPTAPVGEPSLVSPAAPPGQSPRALASGIFPLEVGNEWVYDGLVFIRVEGDPFAYIYPYGERHQLTATLRILGHDYTVERQTEWSEFLPWPVDTSESWAYYRQDRAGLYELDDLPLAISRELQHGGWAMRDRMLACAAPETRAALARRLDRVEAKLRVVDAVVRHGAVGPPGGAQMSELTRLKYPLRPGQEWVIRDDELFTFTAHVERHDVFTLPAGRFAGWRIHIESSVFDENDRLEVWYGRDGFLGLRAHFESLYSSYSDPYGNDSLLEITEQYLTLESLSLVRAGAGD